MAAAISVVKVYTADKIKTTNAFNFKSPESTIFFVTDMTC